MDHEHRLKEGRPVVVVASSPYPEGGKGHIIVASLHTAGRVWGSYASGKLLAALEANAPVARCMTAELCANVSAGGQPARTDWTCRMHSPHVPTSRADCIIGRGGHSLFLTNP